MCVGVCVCGCVCVCVCVCVCARARVMYLHSGYIWQDFHLKVLSNTGFLGARQRQASVLDGWDDKCSCRCRCRELAWDPVCCRAVA